MPQKVFTDRVQAFQTIPLRNLKQKAWIFPHKKTQETSPDVRLSLRGFLWTRKLQIRQPCHKTFARRPKPSKIPGKNGKQEKVFFYSFFLIMCLWPSKMTLWQPSKNVNVKKPKSFSSGAEWLGKLGFYF